MFTIAIDQYVYWENKATFLLDADIDSQWILYLIEKGSCRFSIGTHNGIAGEGTLLLCPPYTRFEREVRENLTFHFFRFSLDETVQSTQSLEQLLDYPLLITSDHRISSSIELLNKITYDSSPFCSAYRTTLLKDLLLLAYLEKYDPAISQLGPDYKDPLIQKAMHLLATFGEDELSITAIAQELSINPCYFARKFKHVTSHSPVEYRNKLRLKRTQKLLIETDRTLEEIAEICGFSNGFYLSRVFSKHIGISPGNYRQQHKL